MAHGDAREGKWRGNWRMEWVASTLHTTSEHGVCSITTTDAHTSAASSRLNWRPHRFKWTRPFRRKTKSGFYVCATTFQTQSTLFAFRWLCSLHLIVGWPSSLFPWGWYCSASCGTRLFSILYTCRGNLCWQFLIPSTILSWFSFPRKSTILCLSLGPVVLESAFALPLVVSALFCSLANSRFRNRVWLLQ